MSNKVKEVLPEFAIMKRITGLNTLRKKGVRRPELFEVSREDYQTKNRDAEGKFIAQYENNVLPKATTRLSPYYNEIEGTFWRGEDMHLLKQIIEPDTSIGWRGVQVRYPKGHPKEGSRVKFEDIDPYNLYDVFFQSEELTNKVMKGGQYTFKNWVDPLDALLFVCYKNNPQVIVRDGSQVSTHKMQSARFEILIPKIEKNKDKVKLKAEFEAVDILNKLSYEVQKSIAYVMGLKLDNYDNPDPDALFIELGHIVKDDSTRKVAKWGMTKRDKFISLAKSTNADLALEVDIKKGFDYRILEKVRNTYKLNNEVLENVNDHSDLFNYFKDQNNVEKYNDLLFFIEEKSKGKD